MQLQRRGLRAWAAAALLVSLCGCSIPKQPAAVESPTATPTPTRPAVVLKANVEGDEVTVDTVVRVTASQGSVTSVAMTYVDPKTGPQVVQGTLEPDGSAWTANELLEPGVEYILQMTGDSVFGETTTTTSTFQTQKLSLKNQIYPTIVNDGATVGVAMPVIVLFDVPVADQAAIERRLSVTTTPEQQGSWHWYNNREVHWRPASFWIPGTVVGVSVDINGVNAGNGVYGQLSKKGGFTVSSRALIMKADLAKHQMQVVVDGKVIKTLPITGGKPGFETRSGTKVIIEKFDKLRMDAATLGIEKDDPNYYDIPDVQWAMRETWSGEFLHAAPWSNESQGIANVSHGCIGLSTENAGWLYKLVLIGDPVIVTGTARTLEPGNGYTDWNASFEVYAKGSALA